MGVQEVGWEKEGTVTTGDYNFFLWKIKRKLSIWNRIFCTPQNTTAVKRVEFVCDRISYVVLRGFWCNIIVLNMHVPSEEKSDDSKDSFYEELEQFFFNIFLSNI